MDDAALTSDRELTTTSLALLVGALAALGYLLVVAGPGSYGTLLRGNVADTIDFALSVQFLVAVPVIFGLEMLWPAQGDQTGFGPHVAIDAFYTLVALPLVAGTVTFVAKPLSDLLEAHGGWLVVDATRTWPLWLRAVVGIAVADFWVWFAHLLKHKVPLFWRFHTIHHSQPRISLFTANRTHPIDALIDHLVLLVPLFVLVPSITERPAVVFLIVVLASWHARFQHANIRTNLGPLRYVFVTPQSHRIHHSTDAEHWDSNYATIFAWDRIFGTQHPDDTSYPETGLTGIDIPEPTRLGVRDLTTSLAGQLWFPFVGRSDATPLDRTTEAR